MTQSATGAPGPSQSPAQSPRHQTPAPRPWWRRPWVAPLAVLSVAFIAFSAPPYLSFDPSASRLDLQPGSALHYPMLAVHVAFGSVALLTCCLQLWPWLRRTYPAVHRTSGRIYVFAGVLPAGLSGFVVAYLSTSGMPMQAATFTMGALWLIFTFVGYRMARQRRFAEHREWMIRSFALCLAIPVDRLWVGVFMAIAMPRLDTVYGGDHDAMMVAVAGSAFWMSWVINLLIAEWWLRYRRPAGAVQSRTPSAMG